MEAIEYSTRTFPPGVRHFMPPSLHLMYAMVGAKDWSEFEHHVCECTEGHVWAPLAKACWEDHEDDCCPHCMQTRFTSAATAGVWCYQTQRSHDLVRCIGSVRRCKVMMSLFATWTVSSEGMVCLASWPWKGQESALST